MLFWVIFDYNSQYHKILKQTISAKAFFKLYYIE